MREQIRLDNLWQIPYNLLKQYENKVFFWLQNLKKKLKLKLGGIESYAFKSIALITWPFEKKFNLEFILFLYIKSYNCTSVPFFIFFASFALI